MILNKNTYTQVQERKENYKSKRINIVHLGLGAFFKAHFCSYIQAYNNLGADNYFINAVSLRSDTSTKEMNNQDNLYTVHERASETSSVNLISCIDNSLFLGQDRKKIVELLEADETEIITLTITEKGYCYSPAVSGLDKHNEDIIHDLKNPNNTKSAIALLCYSLEQRKALNKKGLTLMSCDNLPSNGKIFKKIMLDFASLINKDLKNWIETECTFPSTMVDRIVPKMTDESYSYIQNTINLEDNAGIVCEDFSQFVIEDKFVNNQRPSLEKVGVLFVEDIEAYENMKLRILNGTHSALAYFGFLLKKDTIFEAINEEYLEVFINDLLKNEILPSLDDVKNVNLEEYSKEILGRYANKNIVHKTLQICMDGSVKLPQRWLNTIKFLIENNKSYKGFSLCLAAWIKFTSAKGLEGNDIEVNDPSASKYLDIWAKNSSSISIVKAYFSLENIFDSSFLQEEKLIKEVTFYLDNIKNLEDLIKNMNQNIFKG